MSIKQCPKPSFHVVGINRKTGMTIDVVLEPGVSGWIVTGVIEEDPQLVQFVTSSFLIAVQHICRLFGRPITADDIEPMDMALEDNTITLAKSEYQTEGGASHV